MLSTIRIAICAGSLLGAFVLLVGGSPALALPIMFVESHVNGVDGVEGLDGARTLAISPDGANVYAVSITDNALVTFDRNPITGELTFVDAMYDGQDGVDGLQGALGTHSVTLSPDGANVYVAASTDDSISVFKRDPLTGVLSFSQLLRHGVGGVNALDGAWGVTVSNDGAHVYVAAYLTQAIAVFDRDSTTGELDFVDAAFNNLGGVIGMDDP